jgi:hypothetical protein
VEEEVFTKEVAQPPALVVRVVVAPVAQIQPQVLLAQPTLVEVVAEAHLLLAETGLAETVVLAL